MEVSNINSVKNVLQQYEGDMVYVEFLGNVTAGFYIEAFGFKELKDFQIKIFDYEIEEGDGYIPFNINWLDIEEIFITGGICKIIFKGWNQFINIRKA